MTQDQRQARHVQLESWEVGGELLDILSRGLYSDAKHTIREYVQNGVDAEASHIVITVDGPRAVIRDDGHGMNEQGIRAARRFGLSQKSPTEMVGYRGIGIYSAFGICEEMTITSRQSGMANLVGWRFQFGAMRRLLEADKAAEVRQGIGLPNLMHLYTELITEPYLGNTDDHFTVVEIEGIGEEYSAQLNSASEINDYLLRTVPVAFSPDDYGECVNKWLLDHVGLNPVRISLRIADDVEFDVTPPVATNVYSPVKNWIKAPDGTPLAFAWYVLSTNGRQLPPFDDSPVSGFLMKIRGFTLGERDALKGLWPAVGGRTLYHHYTGEIHILGTAHLYPNAARDDLESSPTKQIFSKATSEFFYPLSRKARILQAKERAIRLLEGMDSVIRQFRDRNNAPDSDAFKVYKESIDQRADLDNVHEEIKRHLRTPRGRPPLTMSSIQEESVKAVQKDLQDSSNLLGGVVRGAERRSEKGASSRPSQTSQPPPQAVLLNRALAATEAMAEKTGSTSVKTAAEALRPLARIRSISRAIAVLDELKASGVELGSDVEASRKEMRSQIGWSPLAPVSLEEALGQRGVSLEPDLEKLIGSIDRGLVAGLGGRGDGYETVLRAVADSVAEDFGS